MPKSKTTLTRSRGRGKGARPQVQKARRKSWTKARRARFLDTLAETCNVKASAKAADMCSQAAYQLRKRDADFARGWVSALTAGYEALERRLLERALFGDREEIWHGGAKVGERISYPDRVALTLFRAHRDTVERARADLETGGNSAREELAEKLEAMRKRLRDDD